MPKLTGFDTTDRFNLTVSLIAYLYRQDDPVPLAVAADYFKCSEKDILRAAKDINRVTPNVGGMDSGMALLDLDLLEEDLLAIDVAEYLTEVPRVSVRQAAAIVSGLSYLQSMPGFENDEDILALMSLLGQTEANQGGLVDFKESRLDQDIEAIQEALRTGRRIRCDYHPQSGNRRIRELDPIRLDPRPDHWYLRAWCPESLETKTFRLDRMKDAEVTDTPISEEARSAATVEDDLYLAKETDTEVVVEVDPEAYRLIGESDEFEGMISKGNNPGTVRATIRVGYLPNIGHLIARYGGAARVISPDEAKQYVRDYALAALGSKPDQDSLEAE